MTGAKLETVLNFAPNNNPLLEKVDGVFEEKRVRSFEDLLSEAMGLEPGMDCDGLLRELAMADFTPVKMAVILKEIKTRAKLSMTDLRETLKFYRKNNGEQAQDLGVWIAGETLNRYYGKGKYLIRTADKSFYEYTGRHWERRSDEQIARFIQATAKELVRPNEASIDNVRSQALRILQNDLVKLEDVFGFERDPLPIINCKNGELWIRPDGSTELKPHNYESYLQYCLDVEYDPHATCPRYDETLADIFSLAKDPAGLVRHWNEFMGYVIQPHRNIPSWWMLYGGGSNGKSKLKDTIMRLMGENAVASMKIEKITERFAGSALVGKLLIVDDDVKTGLKLPDGILKQISELSSMQVEFKGKDSFSYKVRALPMMICNNYPATSDLTHGMARRANIIPFDKKYEGKNQDPTLFPYIWAHEMPGVLNRAIEGLQRLMARGEFLKPVDCTEAGERWFAAANPLYAFIQEECITFRRGDPAFEMIRMRVADFYKAYLAWATDANIKNVPGRNTIKRNIEALNYDIRLHNGYPVIMGLQLKQSEVKKYDFS